MSALDAITNAFVGRVTFSLTNYLSNRRNILPTYFRLKKSQYFPQEVLQEIQLEKVREIIAYAGEHVPFYERRFHDIGLEPEDIKSLEDVARIPALSRQEVIDGYRDMVDRRRSPSIDIAEASMRGTGQPVPFARFRKHNLVRNTSSGSTGAPTVFFEDGSIAALNWAHELRFRNWFGLNPGVKEARMARISTEYMPRSSSILFRRLLWHQLVLPGINLSEEDYEYCLKRIRQYRPRVIWGFTSALTGLGEYMLGTGASLAPNGPDLLITWAAPMHTHERRVLERAFNCALTNIYGSREVGHVAARCPHDSLHLNQEWSLVEIESNEQTYDGERGGEILVTTLVDTPMPFVRYRMGDIGTLSNAKCPCGRTLLTLSQLLGRTGEIFKTKDGRMISPNFWCRTFMDPKMSHSIRRFQVIYTKEKDLRIKIVADTSYGPDTEAYLRSFLEKNFDADTNIDFEYVEDIASHISGKYQMVVNEEHSEN